MLHEELRNILGVTETEQIVARVRILAAFQEEVLQVTGAQSPAQAIDSIVIGPEDPLRHRLKKVLELDVATDDDLVMKSLALMRDRRRLETLECELNLERSRNGEDRRRLNILLDLIGESI